MTLVPPPYGPVAAATRTQRITLLVGLLVVAWLALQLFASILLPFVVAAGIAYFLDPPTSRLQRLGVPRWLAALLGPAGSARLPARWVRSARVGLTSSRFLGVVMSASASLTAASQRWEEARRSLVFAGSAG